MVPPRRLGNGTAPRGPAARGAAGPTRSGYAGGAGWAGAGARGARGTATNTPCPIMHVMLPILCRRVKT
eukprot:666859-Pyramimonas_sp.AAC.1